MNTPTPPTQRAIVELETQDLPAYCPHGAMPIWNQHPRVFLDLTHTGQAVCPYCSTVYQLKPSATAPRH